LTAPAIFKAEKYANILKSLEASARRAPKGSATEFCKIN
jgi:hypothetical protein